MLLLERQKKQEICNSRENKLQVLEFLWPSFNGEKKELVTVLLFLERRKSKRKIQQQRKKQLAAAAAAVGLVVPLLQHAAVKEDFATCWRSRSMQSIVMGFYQHDSYRSLLKSLNLAAAAHASSPPDSRRNLHIVAGGKGGGGRVGSSSVVCSSGRPVQYCHQHPHHEKQDQLLKLLQLQQLLFPILLVMMMMMGHGANAQQAYNNVTGYTCAAQSPSCTSYALYRTQGSGENLTYVSGLFNTTAEAIANISSSTGGLNLTANSAASLPPGTPLFIPLACNCVRRSYQGNVSRTYEATVIWTIVEGNTFYLIANNTYEGLTNYQAIEAANPTQVPEDLGIGNHSTIPLRCACPSTRQVGTRFLLSFAVFPQESSLGVLSSYFNVSVADLEAANEINATTTLQPFSTLLVPLVRLPLLSSISFLPGSSSSAPTAAVSPSPQLSPPSLPPSSSSGNGSSNKNLYVGVGIGLGIGLVVASLIGICLVLVYRRKMKKMMMMDSAAHGGGATSSSSLLLASDVATKPAPSDTIKEYDGGFQDVLLAEMSDVVGSDKPLVFSYEELRDATKDFSDAQRIQGSVFLGQLRGTLVAIKQMKGNMTQELKILTQVHHGNLVQASHPLVVLLLPLQSFSPSSSSLKLHTLFFFFFFFSSKALHPLLLGYPSAFKRC